MLSYHSVSTQISIFNVCQILNTVYVSVRELIERCDEVSRGLLVSSSLPQLPQLLR